MHRERLDKSIKREALNAALASCKAGIGQNIPGGEMQARLARAAMHQVANVAYAKATGASMLAATAATVASEGLSAIQDVAQDSVQPAKPGEIRKLELQDFSSPLAATITLAAGGTEQDIASAAHLANYTIQYNHKAHRVDPLEKEREKKEELGKILSEEIRGNSSSLKHFTAEELDAMDRGVILPSVYEKFAEANTKHLSHEDAEVISEILLLAVPLGVPVVAPATKLIGAGVAKLAPAAAEGIAAVGTKVAARLGLVGKGTVKNAALKGQNTPKSSLSKVKLNKQLASETQMREPGKIVIGPGTNAVLKDAPRLAAKYGGRTQDWVKKSSSNYKGFETHWFENVRTGQRFEMKTKLPNPK